MKTAFARFAPPAALFVAALLAGTAFADGASISGTASYRERIALPPDAVLEVQLADVSLADAPARIIASTRVDPAGQVPIPFTLTFDPASIEDRATYAVSARIEVGDDLWFITDTRNALDPLSVELPVDLMLVRASSGDPAAGEPADEAPAEGEPEGDEPADAALDGNWRLVELDGEPAAEGFETTLIVSPGQIGGNGGCNTYGGSLEVTGSKIDITNVFSTMMACEESLAQEQAFFAALENAQSYEIVDGALQLKGADGTVLARLEQ
ncbi:hypothetical protein VE25_05215 [Devosia geojensis]|uniref:DUF306 domain-containing protein n=1 Tax=Devosia geojensis TaxID=443610 RepID=A0A0F5FW88_9HYPH|nr:YbaY family lipoprotein [Devosia geojensis]KKB12840.1 hypothetical protein VE25_05215 [Devosia geojensis]